MRGRGRPAEEVEGVEADPEVPNGVEARVLATDQDRTRDEDCADGKSNVEGPPRETVANGYEHRAGDAGKRDVRPERSLVRFRGVRQDHRYGPDRAPGQEQQCHCAGADGTVD